MRAVTMSDEQWDSLFDHLDKTSSNWFECYPELTFVYAELAAEDEFIQVLDNAEVISIVDILKKRKATELAAKLSPIVLMDDDLA